jgi:hypothetical protein
MSFLAMVGIRRSLRVERFKGLRVERFKGLRV